MTQSPPAAAGGGAGAGGDGAAFLQQAKRAECYVTSRTGLTLTAPQVLLFSALIEWKAKGLGGKMLENQGHYELWIQIIHNQSHEFGTIYFIFSHFAPALWDF